MYDVKQKHDMWFICIKVAKCIKWMENMVHSGERQILHAVKTKELFMEHLNAAKTCVNPSAF